MNQGHLFSCLWDSWEEPQLNSAPNDSYILHASLKRNLKEKIAWMITTFQNGCFSSLILQGRCHLPWIKTDIFSEVFLFLSPFNQCFFILPLRRWTLLSFQASQLVIVLSERLHLVFSYHWAAGSKITVDENGFLAYFPCDNVCANTLCPHYLDNEEFLQTPVSVSAPWHASHTFLRHAVSLWRQAWMGLPNTAW